MPSGDRLFAVLVVLLVRKILTSAYRSGQDWFFREKSYLADHILDPNDKGLVPAIGERLPVPVRYQCYEIGSRCPGASFFCSVGLFCRACGTSSLHLPLIYG